MRIFKTFHFSPKKILKNEDIGILMELCDSDLQTVLDKRINKTVFYVEDIKWNKKILREILWGLKYILEKGIIHRDLKPANILLKGNTAKISDFGIAKFGDNTSMMYQTGIGTEAYCASELARGKRYNKSVDIYSFGVVLAQMHMHWKDFQNWVDTGFIKNWTKDYKPPFQGYSHYIQGDLVEIAKRMARGPDERPEINEILRVIPVDSSPNSSCKIL